MTTPTQSVQNPDTLKDGHGPAEVWITHHETDWGRYLEGVNHHPWDDKYLQDAPPITDYASNERYVRGDLVHALAKERDGLQAEIARLTAERDQARAEVAAAYERAAQVADACKKQNRPKVSDYHKGLSSGGQAIAAAIRALDPDATDALDRIVKQAVDAETLACAQIASTGLWASRVDIKKAILARIDQRKEEE